MIRYMAKELKVCPFTNPRNALITINAEKKETKNPIAKTGISGVDKWPMFFSRSYDVAANIVGIARKKENSVATFRSRPKHMPPMIVAPALDTPGKRDRVWAIPMPKACLKEISSTSRTRDCFTSLSITNMATPPAMSAMATVTGLNK